MTPLESARWWLKAGFHPIPVPYRQKKPVLENWPALRLTEAELADHFNEPKNVGIILGDEHGAADVDLDCKEAIAAAKVLLPETGIVFGRPSKPASHYIYRIDPPRPSLKLADPTRPKDKATVVELRCRKKDGSTGFQTVVPGSTHPSGEPVRFEKGCNGLAANIDADVLMTAVNRVGAAAVLARHWPGPGSGRHDAFLALAGVLARAGWREQETTDFLFAICRVLWGSKADHSASASEVETTFAKYTANAEITAIPKLKELVTDKAVDAALDWLKIEQRVEPRTKSEASMFAKIAPYPKPLGHEAFYGIAGRFVRLVEPHTEADPNLLLILFLVAAGNVLGRKAYVWAGGDKHYSNLFVAAVGPTATGRKGSATSVIKMIFNIIDPQWAKENIQSGLSSGEGLINTIRDAPHDRTNVGKKGHKRAQVEPADADAGVTDKRLLVIQSEFYGALQAMKRTGNTLSSTIRDAWDSGDLRTMVKHSPARATNAHISIIANATQEELLRGLLTDEIDNGFANRFLWTCSKRSKELPEGGRVWEVDFGPIQREFNQIRGRVTGPVKRDSDADDLWGYNDSTGGAYRALTRERSGLFGAATARAAAQVLRLSLIYALLDGSEYIRKEHLLAALEVWRYCEESAAYIFGGSSGDPIADAIMAALHDQQNGVTRTDINNKVLGRHRSSKEIGRALMLLHKTGRARFEQEPTNGRPVERWFANDCGSQK